MKFITKRTKIPHQLRYALVLAVSLLSFTGLHAQTSTSVAGHVSDEKGELLIGVTIKENGTSNAVVTDINGQYELKLTSANPVITVSYIGFKQKEVTVGNQKVVDIVLQDDVNTLDEAVVVAYGNQRKVSVVGAQSSMNMDEIKMPTGNLSSAIQGRLPGVVAVQRTGEPGHDNSDIWIRGISTFIGQNSSPLVLVDGVERSFNNIDPQDVESFTVLKDASATAVYGVRGANGVIIIKTKPGKVGKPQISVDYYEGIITLTQKPQLANAYNYMNAANEANLNDGQALLYTPQYMDATKKAHGLMPNDNPKMYNSYLYPAVDWVKEMFNDVGHNRRVNVNVTGGVPNAVYYVSLSYYNETGLTRTANMENYNANMSYDRYNYTMNLDLKPTKTTTVNLGFSGYIAGGNYPQITTSDLFTQAMMMNPVYMPLMMPDGSISGISPNGDYRNPYADLTRRGYSNENNNQLNSNIRVTQDLGFWKWSKGLTASAMVSFDVRNSNKSSYSKWDDTYYFDLTGGTKKDPITGLWNPSVFDSNGNYILSRTHQGAKDLAYSEDSWNTKTMYFEASLNYERVFGLHRVGALFLYNQRTYKEGGSLITSRDDNEELIYSLPYTQQGIAARATYSWNDRYFVELNAGYNGSENFSPNKRYGFFPAVGLGWAVSNESFWEPLKKTISYLKIRYTDGLVGNDAVGNRRFMYDDILSSQNGYQFGANTSGASGGWGISKYGVNVGWSTSRKQDIGLDIYLLNDNLQITLDAFKEHRTGIFLNRKSIPDYSGFVEMPWGNLGIVDNKGIEGSFQYTQKLAKNAVLTLRGNFTYNKDKIIEDDSPVEKYPWMNSRGTNVNAAWGYIAEGLFTSEDDILNHAKQFGESYRGQISDVGDIKYKDLNGDDVIDNNDRLQIGTGDVPQMYYGFGADLQVGQFSLGLIFSGTAMVDRLLSGDAIQPFSDASGVSNLYSNITDRWSPNDPTNVDVFYPRLHYGSAPNTNNSIESTWWLKDMSFLRLKQMTIAYDFPKKLLQGTFIGGARVYIMGSNLLTFTKFHLWDPELNTSNGASYPNSRTVSVGLNVNF